MDKKNASQRPLAFNQRSFLSDVFAMTARAAKERRGAADDVEDVCAEEYGELSRRLERSLVQDSVSVRNVLRTRRLATMLIDEEGELDLPKVAQAAAAMERHACALGPAREYDYVRHRHIAAALRALLDDKELQRALRKIGKPLGLKNADQLIKDTLALPQKQAIEDVHARRAALAAWLCYLRQNVGSCFATAPAILIHDEQPLAFLKDVEALMSLGRLSRTFGGIEYTAPLSPSWGGGELRKPVVVPRSAHIGANEVWLSPGLLAAAEAAQLLTEHDGPKQKILALRQLLYDLFEGWEGHSPYLVVTAEAILRRLLLAKLGLAEEDLKEYEKRPRELVQGSLLHQMPRSASGSGGKGELCAHYFVLLDEAAAAFKRLSDNALLKAWEFTVASFAETKATFSRWNFYTSLGFNSDDAGGLGPCIYGAVKEKVEELNALTKQYNEQYEQIYGQVRHLEVRLRRVSSEQEGLWLRAELQSLVNEFRTIEQLRDSTGSKARRVADLFSVLVEVYDNIFPRYFQEVYDADIQEVTTGPFDDSPAGFRLVYKYGRSNTSQWMAIRTPSQFVEALVSFFVATETEILASPHMTGLDEVISAIVSKIVMHVRSDVFLESALTRMNRIHGGAAVARPLENMDKLAKKPWVYTSGGSMSSLVSCYFGLEEPPTALTRWVESPLELLVFLVDAVKAMPEQDLKALRQSPSSSMLMHSPTHAFIFKPLSAVIQSALGEDRFTYTWLRDRLVLPRQRFVDNILLNEAKMAYLVELLTELVPINYRTRFREVFAQMYGVMSPPDFRGHLVATMEMDSGLQQGGAGALDPDEIDALLFRELPIITASQVPKVVDEVLAATEGVDEALHRRCMELLDEHQGGPALVGARALLDGLIGLVSLALDSPTAAVDWPGRLAAAAQRLGYLLPCPIIFADSNWVRDYFAFAVNPGTGALQLWRVNYLGSEGHPMSMWRQWLDGTRRDPPWGLYTRPHQYLL